MTRRERHIRILESFGRDRLCRAFRDTHAPALLEMLSDEGVEKITRRVVSEHKRQQKYNAEHRAKIAWGARV